MAELFGSKRKYRLIKKGLVGGVGALVLLSLAACAPMISKIDYENLFNRQGWNHSTKVVDSLQISEGASVVDLGSGDGYFSYFLADAVGASGKVYSVEVTEEQITELKEDVVERGYRNIQPVLGGFDDPLLPTKDIDLVFMANVYHHIENREAYFKNLTKYLKKGAKVAILDTREGTPIFVIPHGIYPEQIKQELTSVGYSYQESFDFLPFNSFEIYTWEGEG